ncbi:MAG: 50S ribosomal protein L21 [Patescibacteria group bacterium]|nr:50S ribosomal protein L21 [Patescibacteria group bacterium]
MIAVIKTGGKQYKVSPKDKLKVEKLEGEEGKKIFFDQVLLISEDDGKDINIGDPVVKGVKVEAKIIRQARAKKIEVIKHKAKKRYNVKNGHRQYFTEVEIENIVKA